MVANTAQSGHDIVVIGGSTGAMGPLRDLLAALPAGLDAAVFVSLHMAARGTGIYQTVASAIRHLPVAAAGDGMPFRPGHVYLAVPDRHLLLADTGEIRLGAGPRENLSRPAIDALFRSAAAACGPRVVGVLLSGLLNDGVAGLAAIKRCGGLAVVQDPHDAEAGDMPGSALRNVAIDRVASRAKLGETVLGLIGEPAGQARPVPEDIPVEVAIAAGDYADIGLTARIGSPSPLTCPSCGGVLSIVGGGGPLRFRCQIGHAMSADVLETRQRKGLGEALAVALRAIEERAELVRRMADDNRANDRTAAAHIYEERAAEYRRHIDILRHAIAGVDIS